MWYKNLLSKVINFLKNNWKSVLIVLLALLFLFSLVRGPKVKIIQKDNTDLVEELNQYKDRNGNLVSEITQLKLDKEEVRTRSDSLARELKISKNRVRTVDHYITDVDTQFYPKPIAVPYGKDTAYKITQKDNYLNIEATAGKDTGHIFFSLTDTLDRVEKYNPGFLGFGASTDVLMRTKSPYVQYKKGYSFSVKEKTTWITIGPAVLYDPFKNKVSVGVSVQVPLIKIKR